MGDSQTIYFNYQKALRQADRIDQAAEELSRVSGNEFQGALQDLSTGWTGESASLYFVKGDRLADDMNATAGELHQAAADLRTMARRLYEAEMAALAAAADRTYH